ncbi:MAG: hypothetical protein ACYSTS_08580 [Planctomycetota bacterium]
MKRRQQHLTRGYTLTPGYRASLYSTEYRNRIAINTLGLRGEEPNLNKETIFVIGDSFVFGIGADLNETISSRLKYYLYEKHGLDIEVWNLGVPSYSFVQYTDIIKEFLSVKNPSIVILCPFICNMNSNANDLLGAIEWWEFRNNNFRSKKKNENGNVTKPPRVLPLGKRLETWFEQNSAFYNFLFLRVWPHLRIYLKNQVEINNNLYQKLQKGWEIFDSELKDLKELSAQWEFDVILVFIPDRDAILFNSTELSTKFQSLSKKYKFPFVDLREEISPKKTIEYFYQMDCHLTPKGYDFAAKEIEKEVRIIKEIQPK